MMRPIDPDLQAPDLKTPSSSHLIDSRMGRGQVGQSLKLPDERYPGRRSGSLSAMSGSVFCSDAAPQSASWSARSITPSESNADEKLEETSSQPLSSQLSGQSSSPIDAKKQHNDGDSSGLSDPDIAEEDATAPSGAAIASSPPLDSEKHGNGTNGNHSGKGNGGPYSPDGELPYCDQHLSSDRNGSDDQSTRGLLPVLKNRNFLTLWSGQVFSQLADKVYLVLMIAIIASRFQAPGQSISGWVSSLMIAFTIPAILFGSVAGVFVDHWRKRAVLVTTNLLRGGLVLSLPLLLWAFQDWTPFGTTPVGFLALLCVTFLVSTLTQFFAPAEQAAIPLMVDRQHLLSANSLYTMTMMASVIVGFALGEPLLALADALFAPIAPYLHISLDVGKEFLVGGSYAIAGLLLMLLKTNEKAVSADEDLPDVWQNIQDGLRYLGQQARVRVAMIQLIILFSIFAALAVLAVRLAEVMPEIKASQFGFLLAAGGVGMAIGAVLVGQFGQRFSRAQLSLYGSIGLAASLAAVSLFSQHLLPTLPILVALGACAAIAGVPMQTAIQEETPEEMRGKVFGLQNNAVNIALSLPLALAGVAETLFGLQAVFLGLAVLAIIGGVLTWSISRTRST
jgi:MFS family permease